MSVISGKIEDMKTMPWPIALVVSVAIVVIGVLSAMDKDPVTVVGAIVLLLGAFGYAELREIKSNTNGTQTKLIEQNTALLAELAEYRRANARSFQQALESPAIAVKDAVTAILPPPPANENVPHDSYS
jgi:ABC-type transport system involved in cytochrome bd biosynthesis fused ATPase/permease subunit